MLWRFQSLFDARYYSRKLDSLPLENVDVTIGGEHLFLNNSSQLRGLIQARKGNLADTILTSTEPWDKRVDRLFLSILTRPPRPEERPPAVQPACG